MLPADNLVAIDQARIGAGPIKVSGRSLFVLLFHIRHSFTKPEANSFSYYIYTKKVLANLPPSKRVLANMLYTLYVLY